MEFAFCELTLLLMFKSEEFERLLGSGPVSSTGVNDPLNDFLNTIDEEDVNLANVFVIPFLFLVKISDAGLSSRGSNSET